MKENVEGPAVKTGTVVEVFEQTDTQFGGVRVFHDASPWAEGPLAGKQDFNWSFHEVQRVTND